MEPKFKIGDKVRVNYSGKDSIFTIDEIVYFDNCMRYGVEEAFPLFNEDDLKLVQEEEPRKIIGYKVPFDMFGGDWKKGDVVTSMDNILYHIPGITLCSIPKEVVETWEPVYEEVEKPKIIFERVTDLRSACKELGIEHSEKFFNKEDYGSVGAMARLVIIVKALNEGWVADWDDDEQNKWSLAYNTRTKKLFADRNISLLKMPKSLYLKSEELAYHLIKIAEKELLEYFNN